MEKIAVYCRTHEEWDAVQIRMFGRVTWTCWSTYMKDSCISVNNSGYANVAYYKDEGHSFITAAEYLGGKDVKERPVDAVIDKVAHFNKEAAEYMRTISLCKHATTVGGAFTWDSTPQGYDFWDDLNDKVNGMKDVKLSTKPKTTKENNMNTNISNVFDKTKEALLVEKHLGNQIGTSFIDGLVLADKKEEVLKEAKRLEKEEKE